MPRLLLVGNYSLDRFESMDRFAGLLAEGLAAPGWTANLVKPTVHWGRWFASSLAGPGKWAGYLDKYILFRSTLRRLAAKADLVHFCDHGSAPLIGALTDLPVTITCHDLLAVRGSLGEETYCPASRLGGFFQRWILRSLGRAQAVVAVSEATASDFRRLAPGAASRCHVIHNGLNRNYGLQPAARVAEVLSRSRLPPPGRYLLHVGSGLTRKNRPRVVECAARAIREGWEGWVVLAGTPPSEEDWRVAAAWGIQDRLVAATGPDDDLLEVLYNGAQALCFPSFAEGFGWPVIEAQACGCPVLTSDRPPLPEVGGEGALYFDPMDTTGMAEALVRLRDPVFRETMTGKGRANLPRFEAGLMLERYAALWGNLLKNQAAG